MLPLIIIFRLLNGKLRTIKGRNQWIQIAQWLEANGYGNFEVLPICTEPLGYNAWLAGFIDSEFCFDLRHTKPENSSKGKRRVAARVRLEHSKSHRKTGVSYMEALQLIVEFFNHFFSDSSHGSQYTLIEVTSPAQLVFIKDYLSKFPLLSVKRMDYDCWLEGLNIILAGNHYTPEGFTRIDQLRAQMNKKRTTFDWSH